MTRRSMLGAPAAALLGAALLLVAPVPGAKAGALLDAVKSRGTLRCGVSEGIPGFSSERDGRWAGLDVDYCRALAVALFGKADAVAYVPLGTTARFAALREGRLDVLSRNTTWTFAREAEHGIAFAGILFFDGQGFLARRESGARYALELDDAKVCVKPETTSARNLANYFAINDMGYEAVLVDGFEAMKQTFEAGGCDVVTSDQSQLHVLRASLADPDAARVLPEFISKEPLSPAVPASDAQWLLLARLVVALLINAEELGIDSRNAARIAQLAESDEVRGLLDLDGRFAKHLGLEDRKSVV